MDIMQALNQIWQTTGIYALTWQQLTMIAVCCFLLWLGIKKQFEPLLLVPIAFGGILANIPMPPGEAIAGPNGFLGIVFNFGINSGLFPLFIFMAVGAMTDFGPLIAN
ncbi:MAG: sodium ion-translocating decarboxylase subunit beta, partial [Elusimicrobiaceae bacterium]|nr:sodium ion-translocating decarboxylase subunit beta [Elusimicrobiaceae bacterium]